jgi:AcrR family transcriptional regulator
MELTPTPRSRNARGSGDRLRDEILLAAEELLRDIPGEALTLRAVARAAGITAPSIYRHFTDRVAIMRAVAERAFDELERTLSNAAAELTGTDRLSAICGAYLAFATERPQRYRLMFGGVWNAAEPEGASASDLQERAQIGQGPFLLLVQAVEHVVAAGDSTSTDPVADATALWVGLHGIASLRQTTPLFPWPSDIEPRLVRTLARLRQ